MLAWHQMVTSVKASGLVAPEPTWKETPLTHRPSRLAAASSGATSSASAPYLLPSWQRADLRRPFGTQIIVAA